MTLLMANQCLCSHSRSVLALELSFCGIVIGAQNLGFVPQITLTDFAESYIRKKGEVEQL